MKLKHVNPNDEIVVKSKIYFMDVFVLKVCGSLMQKQILYIIFSKKCLVCLQRSLHNVHIINQNGMNQSYPCRHK